METTSKETYIKSWESHIKELYTLAFCPDNELGKEITKHIKSLLALVPKVADSKPYLI